MGITSICNCSLNCNNHCILYNKNDWYGLLWSKKSKHIQKMEEEGHHIHEASLSMWVPYGILAVLTIGIGLIGLSTEHGLLHMFEVYLEDSFGIHSEHAN